VFLNHDQVLALTAHYGLALPKTISVLEIPNGTCYYFSKAEGTISPLDMTSYHRFCTVSKCIALDRHLI